jgi:hypothetical protein
VVAYNSNTFLLVKNIAELGKKHRPKFFQGVRLLAKRIWLPFSFSL